VKLEIPQPILPHNYQVFPQHPTQQAPQVQDPIEVEDENDTDIEYVSTG
jgi:hypothetical protein